METKTLLRILAGIICSPVLIPMFLFLILPIYVLTGKWAWG